MAWKPLDESDEFPTLGYLAADWMSTYLLQPDSNAHIPFVPTQEQLEFLVKLYELDPKTGRRIKHRAVLSRSRGWGKSPFAAALAALEAVGPVVCDGWDSNGQPVGVPWNTFRTPLIQLCATTEDQTANTWTSLVEMLDGSLCEQEYDIDVMNTFIALPRGSIQRTTSSAATVKGQRAVFAVLDQTETWLPSNRGPKFAQVLRNNATKLGGATLETPNAYTIGEDSVAEQSAKTWEEIRTGKIRHESTIRGLLYDHRGAPASVKVEDPKSLLEGLRIAYGDSSAHPNGCVIHDPPCSPGWVDIERIVADFYDTTNDPAQMSADFLNQISAASNAWVTSPEMRAIADASKTISTTEPITLGFDGSEGRKRGIADSTVLIGYSVNQHHLFKVGIWAQPDGPKGEGWQPPRLEIEQTVDEFMNTHNVVGFYADPSAGWASDVRMWEAKFGRRLKARISANTPIQWPQRNVAHTCEAFAQLLSAIRDNRITYDASPEMTAHFLNARIDPRRFGYVLKKPDDDQDYSKIDAAWGAMMAFKAGIDTIGKGAMDMNNRRIPRRLY